MFKNILFSIHPKYSTCKITECLRRLPIEGGSVSFVRYRSDDCKEQELLDAFHACLCKRLKKQNTQAGNKVSIVGCGAVGMSCVTALLSKGITNNVTIYDVNQKLCAAERLDLLHGSLFFHNCQIARGCDLEATKDSRVVVVTCGARPKGEQTRLQVAQKTADILKITMPELVKCSPKATYIIVSNPADVMTWMARRLTNLPYERCFSTGCHLDSARFRMFLGKILGVAPSSVEAFVLGEHGESCVPIWSTVSVGGIRLKSLAPCIGTDNDPMNWSKVHKDVVEAGHKVNLGKGYTNWAIGNSIADVISAIFENSNRVLALSTNAKGMCGIQEEVFLSLPCVVNEWGICGIMRPILSEWESEKILKSADQLFEAQCSIK